MSACCGPLLGFLGEVRESRRELGQSPWVPLVVSIVGSGNGCWGQDRALPDYGRIFQVPATSERTHRPGIRCLHSKEDGGEALARYTPQSAPPERGKEADPHSNCQRSGDSSSSPSTQLCHPLPPHIQSPLDLCTPVLHLFHSTVITMVSVCLGL